MPLWSAMIQTIFIFLRHLASKHKDLFDIGVLRKSSNNLLRGKSDK